MAGITRNFATRYPITRPILTELRIRSAQAAEKPYKLFDERGLFMLVTRAGGRLWPFKYRLGGVEKLLTLGTYPHVSLERAREKRDDARRAVADGIDPGAKHRAERDPVTNTFSAIADVAMTTRQFAHKLRRRSVSSRLAPLHRERLSRLSAFPQIEVDQVLIRDPVLLREFLEVFNRVLIEANRQLLLGLAEVRVPYLLGKIVVFLHCCHQ